MKMIAKNFTWICAAAGILGGALRYWTLSLGEDDKALYPAAHPGWIGYCLLTCLMLAALLLLYRRDTAPTDRPQHPLFPCITLGLAALGISLHSFSVFDHTQLLPMIVGCLGFCSASAMLLGIVQYCRHHSPSVLCWALPCLYFASQMFLLNIRYGGEPEMIRFIPQLLAVVAAALACYQLWGKAVRLSSEKVMHFWQCMAGYLCIAAAPGGHIMYSLIGLWLLTEPPLFPEEPSIQEEEITEPQT